MRRVVLDELDPGRTAQLSSDEAVALSSTGLVHVTPARTGYRLVPRGRVGVVRVGGWQVEVRPKERLRLAHLLFLLGYARNPGFRPEDVAGIETDDIWPAMAHAFALSLSRTLRQGVLQGYRTVEKALPGVRGRIDLATQLTRHPGRMVPIQVSYDDYVVDIAENQVLRTAAHRLLALPGLSPAVLGQLSRLHGQLDGITILAPRDPLPRWQPTRLNQRYHSAVRLAEVILHHLSVTPGGDGGPAVAAFVVEMWRVFEDFVTIALREALRPYPGLTSVQLPAYLAGPGDWRSGEIPMFIDLVHHAPDGRPVAVIDAKYKALTVGDELANADLYQMLAYCTALNVPTAWLALTGAGTVHAHSIKGARTRVVLVPMDLSLQPGLLLLRATELADNIRSGAPSGINW